MAHAAFWLLHVGAALFLWPALFVTVPAHLIYTAVRRPAPEPAAALEPAPVTHCPRCQTPSTPGTRHCRACGCALTSPEQ